MLSTTPSDTAQPTAESSLAKAQLLVQQGNLEEARALLEIALSQSPDNQKIKEVLLQTEKDLLTTNRLKKRGDYEIAINPVDSLGRTVALAGFAASVATAALFLMGETIAFMVRHGTNAPQAVYTRGNHHVYHLPASANLALPLLLFCFCVWIIASAIKSYRG